MKNSKLFWPLATLLLLLSEAVGFSQVSTNWYQVPVAGQANVIGVYQPQGTFGGNPNWINTNGTSRMVSYASQFIFFSVTNGPDGLPIEYYYDVATNPLTGFWHPFQVIPFPVPTVALYTPIQATNITALALGSGVPIWQLPGTNTTGPSDLVMIASTTNGGTSYVAKKIPMGNFVSAGSSHVTVAGGVVDLAASDKNIIGNVSGAVTVNSMIKKRFLVIGHSINCVLYASGGAPFSASQWGVPGGYSNSVADFYTNGFGWYHNGGGFYPSNNASIWIYLTNYIAQTKGWNVQLDLSCAVPGSYSAYYGPRGYSAGQCLYQDQDFHGNNVTYNSAGTNHQSIMMNVGHALLFLNTNAVYVNANGVNYTNPFYLTGQTNTTSFTNLIQIAATGTGYQNFDMHGTPNANVSLLCFCDYVPGAQSHFAPPYNLNPADLSQGTNNIGCIHYAVTNGPNATGVPEAGAYFSEQNDWNGSLGNYFPDPSWTNWVATNQFLCISNTCEACVNAGIQPWYLIIEPFSPNILGSAQEFNGLTVVNNLLRTIPIPGVTPIDLNATNTAAGFNSNVSLYIDNTHYSTVLQSNDANAIQIVAQVPASATFSALNWIPSVLNTNWTVTAANHLVISNGLIIGIQ